MNTKRTVKISKFLSYVLRHKPEKIGIELDESGWVKVDELLEKCAESGNKFTIEELRFVVETNDKKRFKLEEDNNRIRASQGHSVDIALGYDRLMPPDILYHGTAEQFKKVIKTYGLSKMKRHHVHLSPDIETAKNVGARRGKVVVFVVDSKRMFDDGFVFFVSENNVWLTDNVPSRYLKEV